MIGELYTSLWGDYEVIREEPLVLRSVSSPTSAIINPCSAFVPTGRRLRCSIEQETRRQTAADNGVQTRDDAEKLRLEVGGGDHEDGLVNRASRIDAGDPSTVEMPTNNPTVPDRSPDEDSDIGALGICADVSYPHERTLGVYRSPMTVWSPAGQDLHWTPCLSRFEGRPHCYFISDGPVTCPACRFAKPKMLYKRDGEVIYDSHADHIEWLALIGSVSTPPPQVSRDVETPGSEFSGPELLQGFSVARWTPAIPSSEFPGPGALGDSGSPRETIPPIDLVAKTDPSPTDLVPPFSLVGSDRLPVAADPPNGTATGSSGGGSAAGGDAPVENLPIIHPADDPKESVGDFSRARCRKCGWYPCACKYKTPIGRDWRDLAEWKEWCAERSAIIEYDANVTRAVAERFARDLAGRAPRERAA